MKKNNTFLRACSDIDESIIAEAATVREQKPRSHRLVYFAIAACLTFMLLAVPIGILIANRNESPRTSTFSQNGTTSTLNNTGKPILTSTLPVTQEPYQTNPRPSVLDIPGAVVFDANDERVLKPKGYTACFPSVTQSARQQEEWLNEVAQKYWMVIGKPISHTSILLEDGDGFYRVSTVEIEVFRACIDFPYDPKEETLTVLYVCRYDKKNPDDTVYHPSTPFYAGKKTNKQTNEVSDRIVEIDMLGYTLYWHYVLENENGQSAESLFLLEKSNSKTLTVQNKAYELSDYADFVMEASFGKEGNTLLLFYQPRGTYNYHFTNIEDYFPSQTPEIEYNTVNLLELPDTLYSKFSELFILQDAYAPEAAPPNSIDLSFGLKKDSELYLNAIDVTSFLLGFKPEISFTVTINGKTYSQGPYVLVDCGDYIQLHINLGKNLSWSDLLWDEGKQYAVNDIRIDIYDKTNRIQYTAEIADHILFGGVQ